MYYDYYNEIFFTYDWEVWPVQANLRCERFRWVLSLSKDILNIKHQWENQYYYYKQDQIIATVKIK